MTGHILPESTNACPTSPTTDIQPELLETQLGHVIGACSEDDGVPDIGVSIGLGEGSMLWLGELLKRDGADIGFVFHGPDGRRIVAPIWPSCEWQDVADLLRHHVAPILARLTSTTPTLGDTAEHIDTLRYLEGQYLPGGPRDIKGAFRAAIAALSAAPASPIPTSAGDMGKARLALEAIKAVTATTKDAVAGLSRILAITRSAGVDVSYSDLMAKPDVALIVNRPRTEWRHLFECAEACTIPPEGWTCSRAPGHDGPCAASPIPTSVNGAGDAWEHLGSISDPIRSVSEAGNPYLSYTAAHVVAAFKAGHAAALSPALDNTAAPEPWWTDAGSVAEARRVFQEGRRALLHQKSINTHLRGVYEPIIAALEPMLSTLAVLDTGKAASLDNTAVEGLRPFTDWHEDHGDVLWWKLPIHESPYVGSPLDAGRSMQIEIYIGLEQHEFPMANTGGWPFDASDEASLFWSPLPDPRVVTDAVAALTAETEKAR